VGLFRRREPLHRQLAREGGLDVEPVGGTRPPGDTLVVEEGSDVDALADALETSATPPYRAEASRRDEARWAVGIRQIDVLELPADPGGSEVTLTVHDGERTLLVDGAHVAGSVPALEEFGSGRGGSFVVRARRLDGSTWEVEAMPL
jgi:hypothetical protein